MTAISRSRSQVLQGETEDLHRGVNRRKDQTRSGLIPWLWCSKDGIAWPWRTVWGFGIPDTGKAVRTIIGRSFFHPGGNKSRRKDQASGSLDHGVNFRYSRLLAATSVAAISGFGDRCKANRGLAMTLLPRGGRRSFVRNWIKIFFAIGRKAAPPVESA